MEIPKGRWVLKAKLKGKYGAKLEFPGRFGGGVGGGGSEGSNQKNLPLGEYGYFLVEHIFSKKKKNVFKISF